MYIPLTFEGALQKCLIASSSNGGMFISGGVQYEYHYITASTNLEVQIGSLEAQLLVVGGGGGGMWKTGGGAPGGGGGEVYYNPNQRLYKGTYTITIGQGGRGGFGTGTTGVGLSGETTSIVGSNLFITASGGQGATGSVGGRSGNGFAGGTSFDGGAAEGGGGGGGSFGTGSSVSNLSPTEAGDGGIGFTITVANYSDSYGCGGGGGSSAGAEIGFSCYGNYGTGGTPTAAGGIGAPNRGGGGGGAGVIAGSGSAGIVVIQYPVNRYCSTFFNQTGSCKCAQLTFDVTESGGYYPDAFGSYIYLPCNGTNYVTGSMESFYPKTVCAASGSYYNYTTIFNNFIDPVFPVPNTGIVGAGIQCSTGSICANPKTLYTPNCSESKIIAFGNYDNSVSIIRSTIASAWYVGRNSSSLSEQTVPVRSVRYACAVTASGYPLGILGGYGRYGDASCRQYNWSGTLPAGGYDATIKYYACGGTLSSASFSTGMSIPENINFTFCADTSFVLPQTSGIGASFLSLVQGVDCLTGSLKPTCGCP